MRQLNERLWILLEYLVLAIFTIMIILTISQVLFRYVLHIAVPWTEEAARWFYLWQIFLGSAIAMKDKIHLRATFLRDRLPLLHQKIADVLTNLAGLTFLVGVLWGSLAMMKSVYPIMAGSFPISMTYLYLSLPISFTIMIYLTLKDIATEGRDVLSPSETEKE